MKQIILFFTVFSMTTMLGQVTEKQLDDVTFVTLDLENGGVGYGFKYKDKYVGPNIMYNGDRTGNHVFTDINGIVQDIQIYENPNTGELAVFQVKDGQMHGNYIQLEGSEVKIAQTYKKGVPHKNKLADFIAKKTNISNCVGDCMHGFGVYKSPNGTLTMAIHKDYKTLSPVIRMYKNETMYYGSIKKDFRDGFGKYEYLDGSYYFGSWKKGERHGLGILFNKDRTIKSKGYFKNGTLIRNM